MNPTILITGTNRGIGLELARMFFQYGWEIIATCRDPDEAVALKTVQAASDGRLKIKKLDEDENILSAIKVMNEGGVNHILVSGSEGNPVSLVSSLEIIEHLIG